MNMHKEVEADCCNCLAGPEALDYTCGDRKYVFTKREEAVLGKIREASLQARAVKAKVRAGTLDGAALDEAEREIERLRQLRDDLEIERLAAAEERMRLLGHL
ncbi:MAG: hypothetical protein WAW37_09145 [Syntrophobacteraceae bacterium]